MISEITIKLLEIIELIIMYFWHLESN